VQLKKPRRVSETDTEVRKRRQAGKDDNQVDGSSPQPETRQKTPKPSTPSTQQKKPLKSSLKTKSNGTIRTNGHGPSSPLTEWPPSGISPRAELSLQHALSLIARGARMYEGHQRPVPHASDQHYALYATTATGTGASESDCANLHDSMVQLMTLRMQGPGYPTYPWETLEQPSYAFCFGRSPGTITLNQWVSMASVLPSTISMRDSGVMPRPMTLERIFERLMELQSGLEDDDEGLLYKILYKRMLRDPDKVLGPHRTLDKQITDLILVLSRPDWIDFSNSKNQVVTRFIFDGDSDPEAYRKFFHQLLLSLELDLRIHSRQHGDWAKEKLLRQIPPSIQWDLAVARRWREYVWVDDYGKRPDQGLFCL
jgi:hypothetical protein